MICLLVIVSLGDGCWWLGFIVSHEMRFTVCYVCVIVEGVVCI